MIKDRARRLLAACLCNAVLSIEASAQSTELDRPTQIVSREVNVQVSSLERHYYSFEVGPGEFTLMFAGRMDGGAYTNGSIDCQLYNQNMRPMNLGLTCGFGVNSEDQQVRTFTVNQKQIVTLGVKVLAMVQPGNPRYRFRIGGAVSIDPSAPPETFPRK